MSALLTPDNLTKWAPAERLIDSASRSWADIRITGYRFKGIDVEIPATRDFIISVSREGATPVHRRYDGGRWTSSHTSPGAIALLTPDIKSHWRWSDEIACSLIFLPTLALVDVAADAFERDVFAVELRDHVGMYDAVLLHIAQQLEAETQLRGIGERTYVESLRLQTCIHLLRHYANVSIKPIAAAGHFSYPAKRLIAEYILNNLSRQIALPELSSLVGLGTFHFSRKFKATFGVPLYIWILQQRIAKAQVQIRAGQLPLKMIAVEAGFTDQSHMTRIFRQTIGLTPGQYRSNFGVALPE